MTHGAARAPVPPPTLEGRINRLFEVCRPPSEPEREYHNKEVVAAIKAAGREISESHLSELRRGVKDNPTVRVLETIAWFFQVRPGYFIDPQAAAEVEAELVVKEASLKSDLAARAEVVELERELREAMASSGVTGVAQRTGGLDPRGRAQMIRLLIDVLREDVAE